MRGSRYKAACDAGSITVSADYALNAEENHLAARKALVAKLASANRTKYNIPPDAPETWEQPMVSGQIPDGRHVHVFMGK